MPILLILKVRFHGSNKHLIGTSIKAFQIPVLAYKINYTNRHPWMTEQLRNRIKQKNSLYLTLLNHPGDIKLKEQYKREKNKLNSYIKNTN